VNQVLILFFKLPKVNIHYSGWFGGDICYHTTQFIGNVKFVDKADVRVVRRKKASWCQKLSLAFLGR
jgi:hypothetical protein